MKVSKGDLVQILVPRGMRQEASYALVVSDDTRRYINDRGVGPSNVFTRKVLLGDIVTWIREDLMVRLQKRPGEKEPRQVSQRTACSGQS